MPELLRSKRVKARKSHSCATCWGRAIEPGDEYQRDTYAFDGTVYDWVQCAPCAAMSPLIFAWAIDSDEGIGQGEYAEWAEDHLNDPDHGVTARLYMNRLHGALVNLTHQAARGTAG